MIPLCKEPFPWGCQMAKFIGAVVAFAVFFGWMSLVGNPHVVETVIGLAFALVAGAFVYWKLRKFGN